MQTDRLIITFLNTRLDFLIYLIISMAQPNRQSGKRKLEKNVSFPGSLRLTENVGPFTPQPAKKRRVNPNISSCSSDTNLRTGIKKQVRVTVRPRWAVLPPEILVKIFGYVVKEEESAIPCLLNISKVCSSWRRAAHVPSIWNCLRFSHASIRNEKVFKNKVDSFQSLASKCFRQVKSLTCLNIVSALPSIVNTVAKHAEQLSDVSLNYSGKVTFNNCLKSLFELHGERLETFILNGMEISSYDLARSVAQLGPGLKQLMIFMDELPRRLNLNYGILCNIEVLVINCRTEMKLFHLRDLKKLTILRLNNVMLITKHAMEIEWPLLQEIEITTDSSSASAIGSFTMVIRMLASSTHLQRIDFSGHSVMVSDLICHLHVDCPLQYLNISGGCLGHLPSLLQIFTSLVELRLDYCVHVNRILGVCTDAELWRSMEHLSLVATNIDIKTLSCLLPRMEKLKTINLRSCRELPRGFKRQWAVADLFKMISIHSSTQ